MVKTSDPYKITKYNSDILPKMINVGVKFTETYTVQIIVAKHETTYQKLKLNLPGGISGGHIFVCKTHVADSRKKLGHFPSATHPPVELIGFNNTYRFNWP